MKKTGMKAFSVLLALLLVSWPTALTAASAVAPYSIGDVDGNGDITSADARLALRASVRLENYGRGTPAYKAADADQSGDLSAGDARLILRASVGLEKLPGTGGAGKEKAKALAGRWLEDPYQYNEMTIAANPDGTYRANVFFYRLASFENCKGVVKEDGSIVFTGTDEGTGTIVFSVRLNAAGKAVLTVEKEYYYLSAGTVYTFSRMADHPSLKSVWNELTGCYWMEGSYGGATLVRFSVEDGKCWIAPGYWQSEFWYFAYVDENTVKGDLNGVFTCTVVEPGHYDPFTGTSWIPEQTHPVSFDFSDRTRGCILFKQLDWHNNWVVLGYKMNIDY